MSELYPKLEYFLAASQLVLAMLGMGATLAPRDFLALAKSPRALLFGVVIQLIVIPPVALLAATLLELPPEVTVGLVLVAAMPGGAMSNIFTFLGRGNSALSIAMTTTSTLVCLLTTPLVLHIFAARYLPSTVSMPAGEIVVEILWSLLLPLGIGMLLSRKLGGFRERFTKICIQLSLLFLSLMVVGSLASGRIHITAYGLWVPVGIVTFCVLAQILSMGLAWLVRLSDPDNLAIGIEVTLRNMNLALLLKASLFPIVVGGDNRLTDAVLFVILYYGGTSLWVILLPLIRHRNGRSLFPWVPRRPEVPM